MISATIPGVTVEIIGFDLEVDECRCLVAGCRHQETAGTVADVRFEPASLAG